jgi:hypothetical protein
MIITTNLCFLFYFLHTVCLVNFPLGITKREQHWDRTKQSVGRDSYEILKGWIPSEHVTHWIVYVSGHNAPGRTELAKYVPAGTLLSLKASLGVREYVNIFRTVRSSDLSRATYSAPWCWRQYAPPKRRSISTRLQGATSQKAIIFILAAWEAETSIFLSVRWWSLSKW